MPSVLTPVGPVPLPSLIDLRYQPRTSIITKKDGELSLNIQAIAETADTNATLMTKQITEWLGANPTAPSVDWKFGGEQQDWQRIRFRQPWALLSLSCS